MEGVKVLVAAVAPIVVAAYVGKWAWNHRRGWFIVPKGLKLPTIEVACLGASIGTLLLVAVALG